MKMTGILPDVRFQFYIFTFSCFLIEIMASVAIVWLSPLTAWLSSEDSEVPMTQEEVSWLVSIGPIGAIVGAIPTGILSDRFGRKPVLLGTGILMTCSWCVILTTRNMVALFVSQVLNGILVGGLASVAPIYLSEVSPPSIRGAVVGQLNTMFFLGQVVVYAVGPVLKYSDYLWVGSSMPVLFLVSFVMAPESPYYLLSKGREQEARANMVRLRGEESLSELDVIHDGMVEECSVDERTMWDVLKKNGNIRKLICLLTLSVVSQANGTAVLSLYGEEYVGGPWVTLAMGIIFAVISLLASFLSDPCGRRPLLILSMAGSALFTSLLIIYFIIHYRLLLYFGVFGFCVIASIGIDPMIMTLPSELFSTRLRGLANSLSQLTAAVSAAVTLKLFVPIANGVGVEWNFVIATVVSLLGVVAAFVLPETAKTKISST